ncbi:MAG: trypsin-like peptidase domain-containing protein [Phycisphaerae bacterium]
MPVRGANATLVSRASRLMGVSMSCLSLWALSGCSATQGNASRGADRLRQDMRRLIESARDRVFPALVNIEVVTVRYWRGNERKGKSTGSGTIISEQGYVLTNAHVTRRGKRFRCTLADKQEISAKLVGEDPLTDLAVLQLELSERTNPDAPVPVAVLGDSARVQTGDHVMAMGSPWALSRSVTLGIVSNTERILVGQGEAMELERGQRTGLFTRWIQHDAAISPGNSGGPLVNLAGEVVGVNTRGNVMGGDMGFATPSNLARRVADALIESGAVARSWIGVSFKPIVRTGLTRGVLINSVVKGGPADSAGIRPGDLLLGLDNRPVTVRFDEEVPLLLRNIADTPVGSNLVVRYARGDAEIETSIVTERLKKDRGDEASFRAWGLTAMDITEKMARDRRLDTTDGVLISGVRSGGSAQLAEPPLQRGDILKSVDGQTIVGLDDFVALYEKTMETDPLPEYLLVAFDRKGKNQLTLLKPKPEEDDDPPREAPKAWIGLATQPVLAKLAKKLGDPDARGFRITRVYPHTKAADSDLHIGDIILSLNGQKVRPRGMQDAGLLARKVRELDIGDAAKLAVLRDGQQVEVKVALERTRITADEARQDNNRDFEMTVRELTFFDRDERRWDQTVKGVLVQRVEQAGWAGLGGIRPGDLIQRIGQHDVKGLKSYRKAMKKITADQPERVVFLVLRGVQTRFQYVEPDWKPVAEQRKSKDESRKAKNDTQTKE